MRRESIQLIIRSVHQVCSSQSLLQILVYILEIGNFLNFGPPNSTTNMADGFSLRSLSKLSQTKAFTGNTTVLQYIVQSIEREVPDLARFYEEIKLVTKCSKVSLSALQAEKKALEEGQKKVLFEAESVNPSSFSLDEELAAPILKQFASEVSRELEAINVLQEQMEEMVRDVIELRMETLLTEVFIGRKHDLWTILTNRNRQMISMSFYRIWPILLKNFSMKNDNGKNRRNVKTKLTREIKSVVFQLRSYLKAFAKHRLHLHQWTQEDDHLKTW